MNCCQNCFTDSLAKDLVVSGDSKSFGRCDVCGTNDVDLYEIRPESELAYQFEKMLDVFSSVDQVAEGIEVIHPNTLYAHFTSLWQVFDSIDEQTFLRFVSELFPNDPRIEEMQRSQVVVAPNRGTSSLSEFAIFGNRDWDDFSNEIKHHLRYRPFIDNQEALEDILQSLELVFDNENTLWYRARIWNNKKQIPIEDDLREPGYEKAGEGRMSPKGVRCLYISSTPETAMAEIRAAIHDDVAVAILRPKRNLHVLNLSAIDNISPFLEDVNCATIAANIKNLRKIKADLIRPMRQSDDAVEYVPTQYIADWARELSFDGIGYYSVMQTGEDNPGYNIACFYGAHELFDFDAIQKYRIDGIRYRTELGCFS